MFSVDEFKKAMKIEFEMSDLGMMKYFLGIEVTQSEEGIFISQTKYANDVLKRFRMMNCKPDIMFTVSLISRFMEYPKNTHWKAGRRILRYIVGTTNFGI